MSSEPTNFIEGPVAENVAHAISDLRHEDGEPAVGNVLRRTCDWASQGLCQKLCQLQVELERHAGSGMPPGVGDELIDRAKEARSCADINLSTAFEELELEPEEVLMVGVTANHIGFVDRLEDYDKVNDNPYGWRELAGFNAFFAREGEVGALGRRLADCADINFELKDRDGNTVFGFEHGTRTNMFGASRYAFEKDGRKMSFTEYAMHEAIEHYGVDPNTIHINLAAAIKGENNTYTFDSVEKMEEVLPGWREAGFAKNITNPEWQPGDPIIPEDEWAADTREMIIHDIKEAMKNLGIPEENLDVSDIIDPSEDGIHSSNKTSHLTGIKNTRDLYITYIK
ncbi:MAG TPA: hypothetical protein VHA05_01605 [Candidatus Saccharimonadales bacterium]|nr:hypothetical protein [Candidatus Saccharimonadales bacterium]